MGNAVWVSRPVLVWGQTRRERPRVATRGAEAPRAPSDTPLDGAGNPIPPLRAISFVPGMGLGALRTAVETGWATVLDAMCGF